jgi:hypothetical protein
MVQYVPIQPHLDKSAYQPGGCSALHPNHLNIWAEGLILPEAALATKHLHDS